MRRAGWVAAILVSASSIAGAVVWQGPPPSPPPEPLPAEVKLDRYTEMMVEQWSWNAGLYPDAVMPEISLVEEWTDESWDTTIAQCYRDAGLGITGSSPRNWSLQSYTDVDPAEAAVAQFTCDASFPYEGTLDTIMSDAELDALYDYYLHALSPCLRLSGAPAAAGAPVRDAFADAVSGYVTWSPYSFVSDAAVRQEDWERWEALCPGDPPWQRDPS